MSIVNGLMTANSVSLTKQPGTTVFILTQYLEALVSVGFNPTACYYREAKMNADG